MSNLPSLKSLQAFRHAAEAKSFKKAAEQLFVSQAAISQQIKTLEQQLGVILFRRMVREVELTPDGEQLIPFISSAFSKLEQGINQLMDDPEPNRLSLSTLPSFASRWLVPKLGSFQTHAEDLNINISPSLHLDRFDDSRLDLAIRYGEGNYPGLSARTLLQDYVIPVCHPLLINNEKPIAQQLKQLPLLTDDAPDMSLIWPEFETVINSTQTRQVSRLQVSDSNILVEALLSGQGLAAIRFSLVYELLERGLLVCPIPMYRPTTFKYYLVAPEHHFKRPKVQRFEHWLRQEIQEINQSWETFKQQTLSQPENRD